MVLCYHTVSPSWECPLAVTPEQLERQLTLLTRRGWVGAKFSDAVLEPPARRTVAITFDDAFASVIDLALPIMSRLGLPGTVFAPTAFMAQRQPLSWPGIEHWLHTADADELTSMSWDDLGSLADRGWEIGSHTRTHPHLTQLDDQRLEEELTISRHECSERLGRTCTSIAYPYGEADARVTARTREAGYMAGAILTGSLRREDHYRDPRIGVYPIDADWRFRLKVWAPIRRLRGLPTASAEWGRRNGHTST